MNWPTVTQAIFPVLAQAATTPATPKPQPSFFESLVMSPFALPLILLVVFMFLMGGGKRKQERARRELLKQIKRGDRVQTIGGIIGKVVEAEEAKILLKVDESSNTKIWFSRGAIATVLGEEKAADVPAK